MALPHKNNIENKQALSTRLTSFVGSSLSLWLHTLFFLAVFMLGFMGYDWSTLLLVLTTAVSLEAIYLSILIQMTVNKHTESLQEVEEDLDEIQEDVDEIQEDLDEIQEDVDEIMVVEEESEGTPVISALNAIEGSLASLAREVERLKQLSEKK